MIKSDCLTQIQKRLPEDIIIEDETDFDFTDDEYVSFLCWIKYFNEHYKLYGKNELPLIVFPVISIRLRLDFGLYTAPSSVEKNEGKYVIYLSENQIYSKGRLKKNISINDIVKTWGL